ncbi:TetR/AcrR family transcriptional regulator [Gordonia lacunae]|uniref:TetR/AcrR family transcriptional regulator n=1 Tax=Gordonia lacunae TaxID=417102 RepID=UPI0039E2AF67
MARGTRTTSGVIASSPRREQLIAVAAELFLHDAYDSVTVEMICAKAGVSGPALYRHFQNKQALLVAVVEKGLSSLQDYARSTIESETDPARALQAMVDHHITSVMDAPPTPLIFQKNEHAFSDVERRRIRREMSRYAEEWISVVIPLRPDLSEPQVRLLTHSVFAMLNAVATLNKGLDQPTIVSMMSHAALQALTSSTTGADE